MGSLLVCVNLGPEEVSSGDGWMDGVATCQKAEKGWRISIPVEGKVRPHDKIFKLVKVQEMKEIES